MSSLLLGLIVITTMNQLVLSIKVLIGEVDQIRGKKLRNISNGVMISLVSVFIFFMLLAYITHNMGIFRLKSTMFWTFTIIFSLMSYMFLFSICLLMQALRKVSHEDCFRKEKTNIMLQFTFFLLAFATRAIFYTYELYLVSSTNHVESDDSGEEHIAALLECILYIPWNVLPVAFVYYTHVRTFSAIRKAKQK